MRQDIVDSATAEARYSNRDDDEDDASSGAACRCHARTVDVAEVVHDFKSPISTIVLELAVLDAALVSSDVRGRLARVSRNVAYINRLVHELLDASVCDGGVLQLRTRHTDLQQILESIVHRAVSTRDRPRVRLIAPHQLWADVDAFRIERVVCNLLDNALRYSPEDAAVTVRLERRGNDVRVSVADGGPGLTDERKRGLFDAFGRRASGTEAEGHGIGLFVSKRIVEAHGGSLAVDSTPGVGSTFFFDLPLGR